MKTAIPELISEGFRAHPQAAHLFRMQIDFGPAFSDTSSMTRADLIKTLRQIAATKNETFAAHVMTHIADYMESYANQLKGHTQLQYLEGLTSLVVENRFFVDSSGKLMVETATGCCFLL